MRISAALMNLLVSAACSFGMQPLNFMLSWSLLVDNFTGFVEFTPGALFGLLSTMQPQRTMRQYLITGALLMWSMRLTAFLLWRFRFRPLVDTRLGRGPDRKVKSLGAFWILHGTWGFVVSLPVTLTNAVGSSEPLWTSHDIMGFGLWAVGFVLEAVADHVKLTQHSRGRKEAYYCMNGHSLWLWTRNPSFLGETLCWLGLAVVACGALEHASALRLWVWLSPAMTLAIMLGEAALMSEVKNNKRFGGDPAFRKYRASTSLLWPCPPPIYVRLPGLVRKLVFFDCGLYTKHLPAEGESNKRC